MKLTIEFGISLKREKDSQIIKLGTILVQPTAIKERDEIIEEVIHRGPPSWIERKKVKAKDKKMLHVNISTHLAGQHLETSQYRLIFSQ